jgi:glucose-1-phosphate adenylyltransferase
MISEGCILNGVFARNSIIGLRSRLDPGVRVEDSIIMGSDYYETIDELHENAESGRINIGIGRNSIIRRAIIDKNVRIGRDVQLLNESRVNNFDGPGGSYYIRDGIIIIPKNGVIEDGTVI